MKKRIINKIGIKLLILIPIDIIISYLFFECFFFILGEITLVTMFHIFMKNMELYNNYRKFYFSISNF